MKNLILITIIQFALILIVLQPVKAQQVCRGHGSNDIYFCGQVGEKERAIFRSADNGESISVMSTYNFEDDSLAICGLGFPLADVTEGLVYCLDRIYIEPLCLSYDYGANWMKSNSYPNSSFSISGGVEPGKIFILTRGDDPSIYYSDDFGQTFQKANKSYGYYIETGTEPNEIWLTYADTSSWYLLFSNTNGSTFDTIPVPDSILGNGYWFQQFSRGTQPGELFLETISFDTYPAFDSIKLYRTVNYAQSFDLIYEEAGDGHDIFSFTAGRTPCSLYLIRPKIVGDSILYTIQYSNDCGSTFITYEHLGVEDHKENRPHQCNLSPNPVYSSSTLSYSLARQGLVQIQCIDVLGRNAMMILNEEKSAGMHSQSINFDQLKPGYYLITIRLDYNIAGTIRFIKK